MCSVNYTRPKVDIIFHYCVTSQSEGVFDRTVYPVEWLKTDCRKRDMFCFRLAQWIKDAAEKKKEAEDEKKARQDRRRAGPKHVFTDHEYMNQIQANAENIDDALKQGEWYKYLY